MSEQTQSEQTEENGETEDTKKHLIATIVVWVTIIVVGWVLFVPEKRIDIDGFSYLPAPLLSDEELPPGLELTADYNTRGSWTLVFFGFTHCPDICPTELKKIAEVLEHFDKAESKSHDVVGGFISVDPERDTLEAVTKYVNYFHPRIIGVTGENGSIAGLANFFKVSYNRTIKIDGKQFLIEPGGDMPKKYKQGEDYVVNHGARIFLLDQKGQYIGSFTPPHKAEVMIAGLEKLME